MNEVRTLTGRSEIEAAFAFGWRARVGELGITVKGPEREYRFDLMRRWRFDFAWPVEKVAVECDGGQWLERGGRHARDHDREKLNRAAVMGWRVLRFSGEMLERDPVGAVDMVLEALGVRAGNFGGTTKVVTTSATSVTSDYERV